jgi:hypothetical protein
MFAGDFRFLLDQHVPIEDAEMTLHLAMLAAEGIFGNPRMAMEFRYHLRPLDNAIDVEGYTEVGVTMARIFAGLLLREYGEGAFRIVNLPAHDRSLHEVAV